jgi:hypothetical protein
MPTRHDLSSTGAAVRVWESVDGSGDLEVSGEFLHNWMRSLIGIAKDTRKDARTWSARPAGIGDNDLLQWTGSASCVLVN